MIITMVLQTFEWVEIGLRPSPQLSGEGASKAKSRASTCFARHRRASRRGPSGRLAAPIGSPGPQVTHSKVGCA